MATSIPQLGKSGKYGDLKKRLLFLAGALIVFRVGAHIPVPGIDPLKLAELFQGQQGGILGLFNMFSGGALSRFTIFALESQSGLVMDPGLLFRFTTVTTLVTGTMFLMWLGEQVTERGLGNGISIIIFAGIAAGLPSAIAGLLELVRTGAMHPLSAIFICAAVAVVTWAVCFVERGQRKILV